MLRAPAAAPAGTDIAALPSTPASLPAWALGPGTPVAWWADDPASAAPWAEALAAEGLAPRRLIPDATTVSGADAAQALLLHLSLGLPPQLGRLREWRLRWPAMPLVVACRALRDLDHVLALEMGADDVVDSALPAPVLAARLRALWRRCAPPPPAARDATAGGELHFGALEISLRTRRVALGGQAVPLTEGEFEVLWLLASQPGQALARRDILRRVRGFDDHPTDRSIDSRVYRIRAKLGDRDPARQRIRTVRHRGYVFSPVGW
jgi:DNA-binding response OmpR family regulator